MNPIKKLTLLSALLVLGTGCSYLGDRWNDFADIWSFQFRLGRAEPNMFFYPIGMPAKGIKPYPGFLPLYGSIRFTKFFQFGSGAFKGTTYGTLGRGVGVWKETRGEYGLFIFYFSQVEREFVSGNQALKDKLTDPEKNKKHQDFGFETAAKKLSDVDALQPRDRGLLDIGFGAQIVTLGFDINFNPIEFGDFLLGWIGIDYQKDDSATIRAQKEKLLEEENSTSPPLEARAP
ncbi:MAG: hypothetical protein D6805_04660 [Planctomycetota bacterium]|nr:MAG: hypothetical protein D6805_04660 [Planctomycetota bacterium]